MAKNYKDVTKEWLKNATPNSHDIMYDNYFIDDDFIKHPIRGKEYVHSIPRIGDEYIIALFLKEVLGGEIHLVPRITNISNDSYGVRTPDFIWNTEKWDLKTPSEKGKFENSFERFVKKKYAKQQAKNFILNYQNFIDVKSKDIIKVVINTLKNPSRQWVEKVIIIHNNKIIKILERKKESSSSKCPARNS